MSDADRIEQLRQIIRHHDALYYVMAKPEISDFEYDKLMAELRDLEARHPELVTPESPTQRVGGQPVEGFPTVEHSSPMLSIDNTYSAEEVRAFDDRVKRSLGGVGFHYLVDPKVDGVAASIRYEDGRLVLAATRGDGSRGDDVTPNARAIRSIPLRLIGNDVPHVVEVRGEIYWPRKSFAAYNAKRAAEGKEVFANPRNGAAGTLKQLEPKIVAQRDLAFLVHGFGEISDIHTLGSRASQIIERFKKWGLPVSPYTKVCATVGDVLAVVDEWATQRATAEYETDGMVVKVDELDLRHELGATSKFPRWCIAYKYQAEQAPTLLRSVLHSVGRLGTVTPIAQFDPVQLSGTKVVQASMHNYDQVARLDVRVGDTILVEKAGEIIPQVVQVLFEKRPPAALHIEPPQQCPSCGKETNRDEGGVYLRCINPECPAQIRQRLEFFAGRDQMDIDGLGPSAVDQLVTAGAVRNFADLYRLDLGKLADVGGMFVTKDSENKIIKETTKTASNLLAAIEASKGRRLARVLAGLGIRHVGGRAATVLASHFGSVDALAAASLEELTAVGEIGPVIAQSVYNFFHSEAGRETIEHLRQVGVDMTEPANAQAATGPLLGKNIVVTGSLQGFTRSQAEAAIVQAGGRVTSSVSKNTDFVVAGAEAGSKLDKAQKLGVEVIDEAEFVRRLG